MAIVTSYSSWIQDPDYEADVPIGGFFDESVPAYPDGSPVNYPDDGRGGDAPNYSVSMNGDRVYTFFEYKIFNQSDPSDPEQTTPDPDQAGIDAVVEQLTTESNAALEEAHEVEMTETVSAFVQWFPDADELASGSINVRKVVTLDTDTLYDSLTMYQGHLNYHFHVCPSAYAAWREPDLADGPPGTVGYQFEDGPTTRGVVQGATLVGMQWQCWNENLADASALDGGAWYTDLCVYDASASFNDGSNDGTDHEVGMRPIFDYRPDTNDWSVAASERWFRRTPLTPTAILATVGQEAGLVSASDVDVTSHMTQVSQHDAHLLLSTRVVLTGAPSLGTLAAEPGGDAYGTTMELGARLDAGAVRWTITPPRFRWVIETDDGEDPGPDVPPEEVIPPYLGPFPDISGSDPTSNVNFSQP